MMLPSKTFYTLFAGSYTEYSHNKAEYLSAVNRFIKNESVSPKSMIDVGAGDGKRGKYIAGVLSLEGFTILDNSDGMIALAREIPGARIIQADISQPEFDIKQSYDLVLSLWNVLGHILPANRKTTLMNLASLVSPGGSIIIDVNNRYNVSHYGVWSVVKNILRDVFMSNKSNGDFKLKIKTDKGEIETIVHIFNPLEIEKLIKTAGLVVEKRKIINYDNGKDCKSFFGGQLVYKLKKI
ncbi:MAG: class I SAM-dependent methyltransferase [Candidatus Paceibacterota bacterium]